jgi:hypothetical protein
LSETWTLADLEPAALGENVTVIVHVAFGASDAGQSFVWAKSAAFVPVIEIPEIASAAVPEFRSVDDCDALVVPTSCEPNARLAGVSVTPGAVPVPLSATECGLPDALSAIWMLAAREPVAVGAKVAPIVQFAPGARVEGLTGHVVVRAKSAAFAPAIVMEVIVSGPAPEFVSVVVCDALVVPTACVPNARLVGESVTAGAGAPPPAGLYAAATVTVPIAPLALAHVPLTVVAPALAARR